MHSLLSLLLLFSVNVVVSFKSNFFRSYASYSPYKQQQLYTNRVIPIRLNMVFDFLRDRTQEGLQQVQNIASKTLEGKLGEALLDSAEYIKERNRIDAENFAKISEGLAKSRERLLSGITGAFTEKDVSFEKRMEALEEVLVQADIGAATSMQIINDLRKYAKTNEVTAEDILPVLRERLVQALTPPQGQGGLNFCNIENEPTVLFIIGANGMGKTTTIGKIAARLQNEANQTVLIGACDTFRAAAVDQLAEWANRANVTIVKPEEGETDPVPVVERTIKKGKEDGYDVVIIDTSGRLSNNFELIQQLQDMKAAIQRQLPDNNAPHETLLVVDGSVGRNAVDQASAWRKYVGVSGLVVTKLDGTARGGFVVSIVKDQELPVKFIGVGEKIDDLRDFEPDTFVDALLGTDVSQVNAMKEKASKILGVSNNNDDYNSSYGNSNGSNDAASRLRSSFETIEGADNGDLGLKWATPGAEAGSSSSSSSSSSKRKPRPKPQNSKKKKKKDKKN